MTAIWSPASLEDMDAYRALIELDNPVASVHWQKRVLAKAELAAKFPKSGRVVPEFGREDLREFIVASHRVIYRLVGGRVQIVRVFHAARFLKEADIS